MTHTLHRIEVKTDLKADFIFLCTPANGINSRGATPKLLRILEILQDVGPVNMGFYGSREERISMESMKERLHDNSRLRCLFDSRSKMTEVLRRIKDEDAGLSIAVTGSLPEVLAVAREAGLTPHTANLSLGVFGKTELLPPDEIMEVTTMCGHGMISFNLVRETFEFVRKGLMTVEEAMVKLDQPCTCGIVNSGRIREILEQLIRDSGTSFDGGETDGRQDIPSGDFN